MSKEASELNIQIEARVWGEAWGGGVSPISVPFLDMLELSWHQVQSGSDYAYHGNVIAITSLLPA